jgi:PAS domain S-box-containing protein
MAIEELSKNGILQLLGVSPAIADILFDQLWPAHSIHKIEDKSNIYAGFENGNQPADTVILGLEVREPVSIAQRLFLYDKNVPIFILSESSHCAQLKRTLMFSPFASNEIIPWSISEIDELSVAVSKAIHRRQLRLQHQNTIARSHIRLEKLPLLQPEAEHYLDQLLHHAPIGVLTVDVNGTILTANHQALSILDISEQEALGQSIGMQLPLRERPKARVLLESGFDSFARQEPQVFEADSKTRGTCFIEVILTPLAYRTGQKGAMLILQDVTNKVLAERERQRVEEDQRLHLRVLRSFYEISSNLELRLKEKLQLLLKLGSEQFGMPIAVLSQVEDHKIYIQHSISEHPSFLTDTTKKLKNTFCSEAILDSEPLAFESASKSNKWRDHYSCKTEGIEAYMGVRITIDGELYGTLSFANTEPRSMPFRLADLEVLKLMSQWVGSELQREFVGAYMAKLSSALEQAADSVIITDHNRSIEYVNPSFESMTGYTREEVIGKKAYFLRSGAGKPELYDELWQSISSGGVYRGVIINRKKNGTLYHEQKTITPLKDSKGNITHYISTGHDISDLVKAEEQDRNHKAEFAHVARLGVLGEMTSGLAHELNQPLCAITTYAQTCLRIVQSENCKLEDVRYGLIQVVKQAELGGDIFRRLRNFARKEEKPKTPWNIRDIVYEVRDFTRAECLQNQIQLTVKVSEKLPLAKVDPIQVEQVLINLVRNSMDALHEVGEERRKIEISTKPYKRKFICISVSDTGLGCSEEVVQRLYEPFFTTKSHGLGIGLGISQTIVVTHGGKLWLEKNSRNGVTFSFTLEQSLNEEVEA